MNDERMTRLAGAFRRGDRGSFHELVGCLTRMLIAVAYRYTHDWETARDLTQETWLRVHGRIDSYQEGRPFRSWLLAIHRNGCLSHLRLAAVRREQAVVPDELIRLGGVAGGPDPLEDLSRREFADRIRAALARLGERQRQVLALVDIEQRDQKEVADLLGLKPATLRTNLHAARRRLAVILREEEEL